MKTMSHTFFFFKVVAQVFQNEDDSPLLRACLGVWWGNSAYSKESAQAG